jgi:hypothetical protein
VRENYFPICEIPYTPKPSIKTVSEIKGLKTIIPIYPWVCCNKMREFSKIEKGKRKETTDPLWEIHPGYCTPLPPPPLVVREA